MGDVATKESQCHRLEAPNTCQLSGCQSSNALYRDLKQVGVLDTIAILLKLLGQVLQYVYSSRSHVYKLTIKISNAKT